MKYIIRGTYCTLIGKEFMTLHSMPLPGLQDVDVVPEDFQQPLFLLWNPNITHHEFVKATLSQCLTCGLPYHLGFWADGTTATKQPRVLHV